ncbi:KxDL motif-containing protein 1 [Dimargaris cristalligena]|uniref:KxDL domain-containing protein n=1 Tax=Dimargaris cristalligena TaxID=215637 RepID=A0A4P9ZXP9_9FUNG|nr:KxDL motif-containing protein 1 [Dimargaris cristalligena]RKP37811.1 hypothetical protein BJ085DRAFT_30028 [Dimargaris cristalligena]|eukprot:RKP37811.1 hypothetical protein BJ085DRAFT_30028 [Dimargaris cristalligena]
MSLSRHESPPPVSPAFPVHTALPVQRQNSLGLFDFDLPPSSDPPTGPLMPAQTLSINDLSSEDALTEPVFAPLIDSLSNEQVDAIAGEQLKAKEALRIAREELMEFNALSRSSYYEMSGKLKHHTNTIRELKTDIDSIYRRIRELKSTVACRYPEVYNYVQSLQPPRDDDSDD